jgi:hypothetical protein
VLQDKIDQSLKKSRRKSAADNKLKAQKKKELMKQYRQFIVSKFGKEQNDSPANESDSNDDRWGETNDFTSVYSNKKSAKKDPRLESSHKRSLQNLSRIPETGHKEKRSLRDSKSRSVKRLSKKSRKIHRDRDLSDSQNGNDDSFEYPNQQSRARGSP